MSSLNEIKERLNGAVQTRKITNAMYLLSASMMKKSLSSIENAFSVYNVVFEALSDVFLYAKNDKTVKKYCKKRKDGAHIIAVIMSDRGLCGTYNNDIASFTAGSVKNITGTSPVIYCFGTRGKDYLKSKKIKTDHIEKLDAGKSFSNASDRIGKMLKELFDSGKASEISIIYYDNVKHAPDIFTLFPLTLNEERKAPEKMYFEPSYKETAENIVSAYISASMRKIIISSCASENTKRMEAMQNATDNADEMISELETELNMARQLVITNEITETAAAADNLNGC